jgi:hypothetical protein
MPPPPPPCIPHAAPISSTSSLSLYWCLVQITDWLFIAESFIVVRGRAQPGPSQSIIPLSGADHRLTSRNWSVWDQTSWLALLLFNLEDPGSILSPQADSRDWIFQWFPSVYALKNVPILHYVNARSLPSTPNSSHCPKSFCFSTKPQIAVEKVKLLLCIWELPGSSLDTEGCYPDCVFLWISEVSPDIYKHWNWAIKASFHSLSSLLFNNYITGLDSILGIATGYGLEGP